jgi:hypothetical protein
MTLDHNPLGAIHSQVRQPISVLVSGAQRVPDPKRPEQARQLTGLGMQRDKVGMFDLERAQHLIDQKLRVGDHFDFPGPFVARHLQSADEAHVFSDVVGGIAQKAGDLNDVAVLGGQVGTVAGGARIAARRAIDVCGDFQEATRSK